MRVLLLMLVWLPAAHAQSPGEMERSRADASRRFTSQWLAPAIDLDEPVPGFGEGNEDGGFQFPAGRRFPGWGRFPEGTPPDLNPIIQAGYFESAGMSQAMRSNPLPFGRANAEWISWRNSLLSPMIQRREWDSRTIRATGRTHHPRTLVVHHSVGAEAHDLAAVGSLMRGIRNVHFYTRGFEDIGYHFAVGDGYIAQARDETRTGAHVEMLNATRVGIVFLGNFEASEPNARQAWVFIRLAVALALEYDMDVDAQAFLTGHGDHAFFAYDPVQRKSRWFNSTACPGANLKALLPGMRALIRGYVKEARAQSRAALD